MQNSTHVFMQTGFRGISVWCDFELTDYLQRQNLTWKLGELFAGVCDTINNQLVSLT